MQQLDPGWRKQLWRRETKMSSQKTLACQVTFGLFLGHVTYWLTQCPARHSRHWPCAGAPSHRVCWLGPLAEPKGLRDRSALGGHLFTASDDDHDKHDAQDAGADPYARRAYEHGDGTKCNQIHYALSFVVSSVVSSTDSHSAAESFKND